MSSATNDFKEAVELGKSVLNELTLVGKPPPEFLPRARGLIFYTTTRAGLGIGIEHGRGFIISRSGFFWPSKVLKFCVHARRKKIEKCLLMFSLYKETLNFYSIFTFPL